VSVERISEPEDDEEVVDAAVATEGGTPDAGEADAGDAAPDAES
jgi:hypothetical protein